MDRGGLVGCPADGGEHRIVDSRSFASGCGLSRGFSVSCFWLALQP